MSFISLQFTCFVIVSLILYYLVPKKWQWVILLLAGYYFYFCTGIKNIAYILITTATTYLSAIYIGNSVRSQSEYLKQNKEMLSRDEKKLYKQQMKKKQKLVLFLCIFVNLSILLFFKYANMTIAYLNLFRLHFMHRTDFIGFLDIFLPLGISFYTFQTIGYLADVYYGKYEPERNFFRYALFVSFFPQMIQGPISRFKDLAGELYRERSFEFDRIKSGFYRVMWGLFKKLVIADRLSAYVSVSMEQRQQYPGLYLLFTIFFYSMQIYGDFSGGIDIALGVSELFGIRITENFERPFFSKDIAEYWRRWHITLGTWFRDYIFYPLSINKGILNLGKAVRIKISDPLGKRVPLYLPMIIVWITTGMWHGAESKYVVWGLLNCLFIILGTEFKPVEEKLIRRFKINEGSFFLKLFRVIKTFWLMAFLRVFDIAPDTKAGFETIGLVFRSWKEFNINNIFEQLNLPIEEFTVAIIAIIIMFIMDLIQRKGSLRERIFRLSTPVQWVILSSLIFAVTVFGSYGMGYDAKQFIYLQF
ncbi:MAG: MBOAT family protein [Lachnospiraceae bacterium]|nr:MBOAT family protein [Lachnospiraceae bacterium]